MTKPSFEERFLGCLIGTAVGDALGAPWEHQILPKELTPTHIIKDFITIPGFPKGQYTDDTQLTIATAESIITKRKIDGEDIAQRFAKLWKNHEILGQGIARDEAIHRMIRHHVPWSEAGAPEGQAGNGAAMRISPVGLWNHDQTENLPGRHLHRQHHHPQRQKKHRRGTSHSHSNIIPHQQLRVRYR